MNFYMQISIFLVLGGALSTKHCFAGPLSCEGPVIKVQGINIKECRESAARYNGKGCESTGAATQINAAEVSCVKRLMNKVLDERLLALKTKNPPQFRREMDLQKVFNAAVKEYCDGYEKCQGSMFIPMSAACPLPAYTYRIGLALAINTHALELSTTKNKNVIPSVKFTDFASALCALPDDVWKEGKTPHDCVLQAKQSIAAWYKTDVCALE